MTAAAELYDAFVAEVDATVDAMVEDSATGDWREDPADFDRFVESPEHLHLPPLYPRQRAAALALLGGDPKLIFAKNQPRPMKLQWAEVRSSNVRALGWHDDELYVQFKSGGAYRYHQVTRERFEQLLNSKSVGKALGQVKARHKVARLRSPDVTIHADRSGRAYQVAVMLWGKGSGKDYLSSVIVCYCVHVLLCLRNPQRYFGFAPGESIDVVNVAYNADQAKKVFFEKLKQRLKRWRWLRERYNVIESGRRIGDYINGRGQVSINDVDVEFPRGIRAFSRHAQNESYEGLNVLVWVMDEASAFLSKLKRENADAIYQTLRTSAGSRFKLRWLGFILSFPRHGDDFTMTKLAEAEKYPHAGLYGDGPAATWEVNLAADDEHKVEVAPGHWVPVSLANDYELDYDEAKARYECDPPAAVDALIKHPDRIWAAVAKGRRPLIEWEPTVVQREVTLASGEQAVREFAAVQIKRRGRLPKGTRMFFHGDPAYSSDAFALAFGHGVPATVIRRVPAAEVFTADQLQLWLQQGHEPDELVQWEFDVTKTIIDALIVWRPDRRRNRPVDLLNVKEVLLDLTVRSKGGYRIEAGTFDSFESAETVQALASKRVPVENEQWSNPLQVRFYKGARSNFYNDLVSLPDDPTITSKDPSSPGALYELERVELIEDRKVDHPEGGSKDLADAVVRVIEHVSGQPQAGLAFGTMFGTPAAYPNEAGGYAPSETRKTDPAKTPSPATRHLREQDAARQVERPLGELAPDQPRRGKLAFGSIPGNGRPARPS